MLGLPENADYNSIQRAYRKRLADVRGRDEKEQGRIEAAHSRIMMSALTSRLAVRPWAWGLLLVLVLFARRMQNSIDLRTLQPSRYRARDSAPLPPPAPGQLQGNTAVDKGVLYADKARYFPWRPRVYRADNQLIMYAGAAQLVMLAWALLSPLTAGTQPVIWCE